MKKAYIQPSMEEYKLELANMIASSPLPTSNETPTEWGAPALDIPTSVFDN